MLGKCPFKMSAKVMVQKQIFRFTETCLVYLKIKLEMSHFYVNTFGSWGSQKALFIKFS